MPSDDYTTFEDVKSRLDQIVDAVNDDALPLDDALALYEEAVGLGLRASDLLEENIEAQRAADQAADEAIAAPDAALSGEAAPLATAEPSAAAVVEGEAANVDENSVEPATA